MEEGWLNNLDKTDAVFSLPPQSKIRQSKPSLTEVDLLILDERKKAMVGIEEDAENLAASFTILGKQIQSQKESLDAVSRNVENTDANLEKSVEYLGNAEKKKSHFWQVVGVVTGIVFVGVGAGITAKAVLPK